MSDVGRYEAFAAEIESILSTPVMTVGSKTVKVGRSLGPESAAYIDGIQKPHVTIAPAVNEARGRTLGGGGQGAALLFQVIVVTEATLTEQGHRKAMREAWNILELTRDRLRERKSSVANSSSYEWAGESYVPAVDEDVFAVFVARYTIEGPVGN